MIGFIFTRHVTNELTNKYWIRCYKSIRRFYPKNTIVIIDDNSDYYFVTPEILTNTIIIQSEYPGRGELLPYYYYSRNRWFDTAVIIHDSVFINASINLNVDKYKFFWYFLHHWDTDQICIQLLQVFENSEIIKFYKNKKWLGCFGAMTIITHNYLSFINNIYDFSLLLPVIKTRDDRKNFERIIACLLQKHHKLSVMLGDIREYSIWGITFNNLHILKNKPVIKIWSGR